MPLQYKICLLLLVLPSLSRHGCYINSLVTGMHLSSTLKMKCNVLIKSIKYRTVIIKLTKNIEVGYNVLCDLIEKYVFQYVCIWTV